jgi:two-component system sensor histidine kinase HydH
MIPKHLSIRAAILSASLALVSAAIVVSGALGFAAFRKALQVEIGHNLQVGAAALLARIDAFFFERLEDMREWRRLELLQDLRVGDVDKRLARLLGDLRAGHGAVYRALFCTDTEGRIIAASDPALVGGHRVPAPALLEDARDGLPPVVLEAFTPGARAPRGEVVLRTGIANAFAGGDLGYFYAVLSWDEVGALLKAAIAGSRRSALLLGADGRPIAAAGPPVHLPEPLGRSGEAGGSPAVDGLLIGAARSTGYQHFAGLGWRTLLVEPTAVAYAPVWRLGWAMAGLLVPTLAVAGWLSLRISARIARPLAELTAFTRRLPHREAGRPPHIDTGVGEVTELARAFDEMIEALERSREQLVRAGKLAAVGEMAAVMAHEVRTPLGILKSSAQLLARRPGLGEEDRELVGYIGEESDRLNGLVTTLLECASPRPPRFMPLDVHAVLEQVLALVAAKAEKRAIGLELRRGAGDALIEGDREQLIQVFLNLLLNPIQLLPANGRVRIVTEDARPDSGAHGGEGDSEGLRVHVDDDGPGIPPEDRPRVLDPFFTRREGGIGLGLTIVEQIVRVHGGRIAVAVSPWGGARFTLDFPRQRSTDTQ